MNKYGRSSRRKLATAHPVWTPIMEDSLIVCPYDITIVRAWSGEDVQNALYDDNKSTKIFPDSRHNKSDDPNIENPLIISDALDIAPYIDGKIPWGDTHIFAYVVGCICVVANDRGVKIRWGGDWDSDGSTKDQSLMDWGHIELLTY